MQKFSTIDLWLDTDSDSEASWIVSGHAGNADYTLATFAEDDYADALEFAKEKCRVTGCPVVAIDDHGNREKIYEIDQPVHQ